MVDGVHNDNPAPPTAAGSAAPVAGGSGGVAPSTRAIFGYVPTRSAIGSARGFLVVAGVLILLIFIADVLLPDDILLPMLYVVPLLLVARSRLTQWVWFAAALCVIFTYLD